MVKIELSFEQLQRVIQKLPHRDKIRLIEKIEHDTWKKQFQQLLKRIRTRVKKNPISQREIDAAVQEARRQIYARRH